MDPEERVRWIRSVLRYRGRLAEEGVSDRELRSRVRAGRLIRVAPGCFVERETWVGLRAEDRLLARTVAVAQRSRGRTVLFSHHSAAAIWGLPLYGHRAGRAHALTPLESPGRSSPLVTRHVGAWSDDEVCEIAGIRVTSLTRTVVDLARQAPAELAIGCADAGLRTLFGACRESLPAEIADWREARLASLEALRGRPGVRVARRILELADPRADSVAESVSRLQFARLGIEVEIQVRVPALDGSAYWIDFELCGQGAFGEVDGAIKYTDPGLRRGRTPEQVVLDEKRREDEVRGITRKRFVRWGIGDAATARLLGERMLGFGIRVPAFE